jgi:SnoaL-like domain
MMKQFKQAVIVLQFALFLLACMAATNTYAQDTQKEKTVKTYYSGFENKDWNTIAGQLADGFTFTSPTGDDHISVEAFKEKCFPTSKFTKKVSFLKMVENGNELFLLVQINTTDNKIVRNVDIFTFDSLGKIKSHECFFGAGAGYPGHNTN